MGKTHQVHIVTINGERFKRVTFVSSSEAEAIATGLKAVSGLSRFPGLVALDAHRVWTEFVPGELARRTDVDRVAEFFVDLYQLGATRVETRATNFPRRLADNLGFLVSSGVIAGRQAEQLQMVGRELEPEFLELGHDYIDPLLKNFVVSKDRAIGIDIEALAGGMPIGTGLAKARLRWMGSADQNIMQRLNGPQSAGVRHQYRWVRLCFLAGYFHQKVLQRKRGLIQLSALEEFAAL